MLRPTRRHQLLILVGDSSLLQNMYLGYWPGEHVVQYQNKVTE